MLNFEGMKFALLEIKLTLVKLIKDFSIEPSENTPSKDEYRKMFIEGFAVRRFKDHLKLVFKKRQD
jgi:hypothetical protein